MGPVDPVDPVDPVVPVSPVGPNPCGPTSTTLIPEFHDAVFSVTLYNTPTPVDVFIETIRK